MRWPWRVPPTDPKAHEAVAKSDAQLRELQTYTEQVDLVAARLAERRRQNRFGELIEQALQVKRGHT